MWDARHGTAGGPSPPDPGRPGDPALRVHGPAGKTTAVTVTVSTTSPPVPCDSAWASLDVPRWTMPGIVRETSDPDNQVTFGVSGLH